MTVSAIISTRVSSLFFHHHRHPARFLRKMYALREIAASPRPSTISMYGRPALLPGDGTVVVPANCDAVGDQHQPSFLRLVTPGPVRALAVDGMFLYVVTDDGSLYRTGRRNAHAPLWRLPTEQGAPVHDVATLPATEGTEAIYVILETGELRRWSLYRVITTVPLPAPAKSFRQGCRRSLGMTMTGRLFCIEHVYEHTDDPRVRGGIVDRDLVHHFEPGVVIPGALSDYCSAGGCDYLLSTAGHLYYGDVNDGMHGLCPAVFYRHDVAYALDPPVIARIIMSGTTPLYLTSEGDVYADYRTVVRIFPVLYDTPDLIPSGRTRRWAGRLARLPLPGPVTAGALYLTHGTFVAASGELYVIGQWGDERAGDVRARDPIITMVRGDEACRSGLTHPVCIALSSREATFSQTMDGVWHYAGHSSDNRGPGQGTPDDRIFYPVVVEG